MSSETEAKPLKLSRYVVASEPLGIRGEERARQVVFSTRSGEILIFDEFAWRLITSGALDRLPPLLREQARAAGILVPADEDELGAVLRENRAAIAADDVLYEVIQPTAWCQLACGYCGQEHSEARLGDDDQAALLERLQGRLAGGRYRELHIGWFGAEPLAGLAVMRSLSPALRALAAASGCSYRAKIVTNGLALTVAVADELVREHQVSEAEITLDGPAQEHDHRRQTKRGGPSFARILDNVIAVARATALGLVIRCNVDRSNAAGVPALIDVLAEAGLQSRIRFYTSPVHAWGNDAHLRALGKEEYAQMELEWLAQLHRLGFAVGLVPQRRPIVCMSVRDDAEVVDATGATYNCTEVSYVPGYGSPNLYALRLPGAPRARPRRVPEAARLQTFNDEILAGAQPSCGACPMLPVCGGQCPKSWHEGHEPCPSARRNMPQRLSMLLAAGLAPPSR